MSDITEEMLMAYADGELSQNERRRVEAYLVANPAAAKRVADFVRSGRALARMFDAPMHEPVPARLLAAVLSTPPTAVRPVGAVSIASRLRALFQPMLAGSSSWPAWAGVSCGLLVAGAVGWGLSPAAVPPSAAVNASAELRGVLEHGAMGATQSIGTGSSASAVTPVLTFLSQSGSYCRQYDRSLAAGGRVSGVGCRQTSGEWYIEIEAAAASGSGSGYKVAGRAAAPAVEATVNRLIRGVVLGPQEETQLIGTGWQRGR